MWQYSRIHLSEHFETRGCVWIVDFLSGVSHHFLSFLYVVLCVWIINRLSALLSL